MKFEEEHLANESAKALSEFQRSGLRRRASLEVASEPLAHEGSSLGEEDMPLNHDLDDRRSAKEGLGGAYSVKELAFWDVLMIPKKSLEDRARLGGDDAQRTVLRGQLVRYSMRCPVQLSEGLHKQQCDAQQQQP